MPDLAPHRSLNAQGALVAPDAAVASPAEADVGVLVGDGGGVRGGRGGSFVGAAVLVGCEAVTQRGR